METKDTTYHRCLRVTSVVVALVLVFDSGIVSKTTATLSAGAQHYVATAVGMSAGVQPNGINQYTAALTAKERELAEREAVIKQREIDIGLAAGGTASDRSTYLIASVLFVLLTLIVLNYILDYLRLRERRSLLADSERLA